MSADETVPLAVAQAQQGKRRGCATLLLAVLVGAAFGGIAGLLFGQVTGLVTAAVFAGFVAFVSWASGRRRIWLAGNRVYAKTVGTKSVDLHRAERIELMVSDVRNMRTISVLIREGKTSINVSLAVYAGMGGRELGILPLRRLADAFAGSENTAGLVFSQLLVAQLRAEAQGAPAPERPLYRLASAAPQGRLAQRLTAEAVTRFVATLD